MANIRAATDERIFKIAAWRGLNENPDGDTKLKLGEAAVMRNWRVTRDGNLQRRPGTQTIKGLMREYILQADTMPQVVKTSARESGQFVVYSEAVATQDGFVEVSGRQSAADYENWRDYIGWYWKNGTKVWQLAECVYNEGEDSYTWRMKRVHAISTAADSTVKGLWSGLVGDKEYMVAACDGRLWAVHNGTEFARVDIGEIDTTDRVFMFGYSKKLYIMNGKEYKEWDGTAVKPVEGYRPLVTVAVVPSGGGVALEQINKLSPTRRCRISPDGTATAFTLPEKDLVSIDYVKVLADGSYLVEGEGYTADLATGVVTFTAAPAEDTNSIEIGWTVGVDFRHEVLRMRYAETFSGAQDNRVFIYGDGSNRALYSGLDYDGNPRADYFPDMNVLDIGEANTPITALIRHYSRLMAFKTNSTYSVQYDMITLADGSSTAAFYSTPVNRSIGNAALGQARLVLNSPYTLFGKDVYEWRNNASYSSNLSIDERQAKRISDRVTATLDNFSLTDCYCWDDNDNQEYYICCGDKAVIHNYAADAWFCYTGFDAVCMANHQGELYCGTSDGKLKHISYTHSTDDGEGIDAYWESGSMSFDRDFMRKYSAMLWIGLKPEPTGEVNVTVQTDRKSQYTEKVVSASLATFDQADFADWSFSTNRQPQMTRLKIKAKKFVYYKLILKSDRPNTTATVLAADIRVRYTGYAR